MARQLPRLERQRIQLVVVDARKRAQHLGERVLRPALRRHDRGGVADEGVHHHRELPLVVRVGDVLQAARDVDDEFEQEIEHARWLALEELADLFWGLSHEDQRLAEARGIIKGTAAAVIEAIPFEGGGVGHAKIVDFAGEGEGLLEVAFLENVPDQVSVCPSRQSTLFFQGLTM